MKKNKIVFVFLFAVLLSCEKKDALRIKVTDIPSGKAANYLNVSVDELGERQVLKQVYWGNDFNGDIVLHKNIRKNHKYIVTLMLPYNGSFYYDKRVDTIQSSDKDWAEGVQFNVAKWSVLNLFFNNVYCQGTSDTVIFNFHPEDVAEYSKFKDTLISCLGSTMDTLVFYGKWVGNWQVIRNGISTYFDTTFFVEGHETDIKIDY